MFTPSPIDVTIVGAVALVVLGPDKLPQAIQKAAKLWSDVKRFREALEHEVRTTFTDLPSSGNAQPATQGSSAPSRPDDALKPLSISPRAADPLDVPVHDVPVHDAAASTFDSATGPDETTHRESPGRTTPVTRSDVDASTPEVVAAACLREVIAQVTNDLLRHQEHLDLILESSSVPRRPLGRDEHTPELVETNALGSTPSSTASDEDGGLQGGGVNEDKTIDVLQRRLTTVTERCAHAEEQAAQAQATWDLLRSRRDALASHLRHVQVAAHRVESVLDEEAFGDQQATS